MNIIKLIIDAGIANPQVCFCGIGDGQNLYEAAAIQCGEFESSDDLMEKWLKNIYLEGCGAGNNGNITAKVRALKLSAIQLRIAGLYARRNDTLNVPFVQKTNEFTPEEALIEDGKIVIYKKLRRN